MSEKTLSDVVRISRRFRRSVRVDADMDVSALEGFVCPQSAGAALLGMAKQFAEAGQGAFTWTGPYGCGKSSIALALAALLGKGDELRAEARKGLGKALSVKLEGFLRNDARQWEVLPVVGRRTDPKVLICSALTSAAASMRACSKASSAGEDPQDVLDSLVAAARKSRTRVLLLIDEMGKLLEHAASTQKDVYFFQLLAEAASRSDGHLLVVGILHQAFDDYAHRLSRETRDEWLKIQGRYVDIPINVAGEEQIELVARALETQKRPASNRGIAGQVAAVIAHNRASVGADLGEILHRCWPLHPATACLLGPISRRRFGQNQRSIFGFINSAEPFGFREFLEGAPLSSGQSYDLVQLWAYLRANLEPSILSSPDGHRWSLAVEAVSRCEAKGGDWAHFEVLKTIALVDLFKERSGLVASKEMLRICLPHLTLNDTDRVLRDLAEWSVIIYKRHLDGYAIFAGSDFDIERAVREVRGKVVGVNLGRIRELAALQPILAKRHYHQTGALRWFELDICAAEDAVERARDGTLIGGAAGLFLLIIATRNEEPGALKKIVQRALAAKGDHPVVIGWTRNSWAIREHAAELIALETIRSERPELRGDEVARREVLARISLVSAEIQEQVREALVSAEWEWSDDEIAAGGRVLPRGPARLSALASAIADKQYEFSPIIPNELLNRTKPSSNAVAAQRALLNAMVSSPSVDRLAIEGWPAEAGLYASLLERTGLHIPGGADHTARFVDPSTKGAARLSELWRVADVFFQKAGAKGASLEGLYERWRQAPYGVREGLLPILATAFYLSRADRLSLYLDGIFTSRLGSMYVDRLLQDPDTVRVRWSEFSPLHRAVLSGLSEIVAQLVPCGSGVDANEPISVARGLVAVVDGLHPWTLKTGQLPPDAERLRKLVKDANDPNRLILDDLPTAFSGRGGVSGAKATGIVEAVAKGMRELADAYPMLLNELEDRLLSELRVPLKGAGAFEELRRRALTVRGLTGDFRLDAFAVRLSTFGGERGDLEAIASLAANKPTRDWVDRDVDRARAEIAVLAQQFLRAEAVAHVKGREGRVSMAIVIGDPRRAEPVVPAFDVSPKEIEAARDLARELMDLISSAGVHRDVALAAIAEAGARLGTSEPTAISAGVLPRAPAATAGKKPNGNGKHVR
ncbi:ATPase family associated with various cellular activities (AAA) [Methylobacterium sp. 174MFSha1.1]|uniref:AAA family ATPase n=1 Tax=Methylobacterium sp. 174MFSha1.1 TaxID=1502749 RepID=UPI0008EB43E3|nr:AAA family ATPase [Methylobacterium sp. 174MFSha1.1]SFU78209.1 ATPase family associated with various cellular activities (AAA) [Methylobacterium sp. 174MFSha1.1]